MNNQAQWAAPTPLRPDGTNLLPFPVNALPPILREMASAIATTTSTDVAMAGTAILSAVSYCFTGVYRMSAKRDHTEPLLLYALTVAEPSFKKSPVISLVKRPYIQFAHDWNENNKQDIYKADELAEQNAQADAELAEKRAAIESAEKKTAKLIEIDSIEVKKSVFGKKVTLSDEDYNNLVALAQKQVVSVKDNKKLKAERKTLLQKVADLESSLGSATSELAVYKNKEAEKGLFSRKQLNAESKRISETERLKTSLRKALAVIDAHGLRSEYEHIKLNTAQRKSVLE